MWIRTTWTYKGEVSCYLQTLQELKLWNSTLNRSKITLRYNLEYWNTLFTHCRTLEHTFRTHLNTLWITNGLLNSRKYTGACNCLLFFYLYLLRVAILSIEQLSFIFEFQIFMRLVHDRKIIFKEMITLVLQSHKSPVNC